MSYNTPSYPIILIIILSLIAVYIASNNKNEHFSTASTQWDPQWMGRTSDDCYSEYNTSCMNYSNCGLCLGRGTAKCVPGDINGPFFNNQCDGWAHTDYYDRHLFGEKVVTVTPHWSKFYPEYEYKQPGPVSIATLQ